MARSRASKPKYPSEKAVIAPSVTAEFLSELSSPHCKISVLDLSHYSYAMKEQKPLNLEEVGQVVGSLKENISVKLLDMGGVFSEVAEVSKGTNQLFDRLMDVLKNNHVIQELSLQGAYLSDARVSLLEKTLRSSSLVKLDLLGCQFEDISKIILIIKIMQYKKNFEKLDLRLYNIHEQLTSSERCGTIGASLKILYDKLKNQLVFDAATIAYLDALKSPNADSRKFVYPGSQHFYKSTLSKDAKFLDCKKSVTKLPVIPENKKVEPSEMPLVGECKKNTPARDLFYSPRVMPKKNTGALVPDFSLEGVADETTVFPVIKVTSPSPLRTKRFNSW